MGEGRVEDGGPGRLGRVARRLFHTPDHPDRGFYRAVGVLLGLGLLATAVGLGAAMDPDVAGPTGVSWRLGAGLVVGPMFVLFGLGALIRRRRQGPQSPGRHTRD